MVNEDKFVKALNRATKDNKITWHEVEKLDFPSFKEVGEQIEVAFYFFNEKKNNHIIIYKSISVVTDPYYGEDFEKVNIHLVFTEEKSFRKSYRISDFELADSEIIWTLFKLIQRQKSKADEIMKDIMEDFDDILDF